MAIIGLLLGIAVMAGAILLGGETHLFMNLQAFLVVLGGTVAATLLTMSTKDLASSVRALIVAFFRSEPDLNQTVRSIAALSKVFRERDRLGLAEVQVDHPFLRRACDLAAENASRELITHSLQYEINHLVARHARIQAVFRRMGAFAPSFGMIGTVIGLIQMFAQMDTPANMGPAMSLALLTTLYGGLLAFMVFTPLAAKLKVHTAAEVAELELIRDGMNCILTQVHPAHIEEHLRSHLPAVKRSFPVAISRD